MKNSWVKKLVPHLVAILIFLVVSVLYCRPALDGKVVNQHDITQWQGAIQQSVVFKDSAGQYPLWTNSMFGGMPSFQIGSQSNNFIPSIVHQVLTLKLPEPIQFFFLASICFYFLCVAALRLRVDVSVATSLLFAFATYNPVVIVAGHVTKMWSIAYMPALLGSILMIYDKRYWIGAMFTAIFTSVLIAMNHPQIDYYFFLSIAFITLFFIINWIRKGELKHLGLAMVMTLVAGGIGVATSAVVSLSTYEYQKETIRGGGSELTDSSGLANKSPDGLDKRYAFDYSTYKTESFVMLVPRIYGGSSDREEVSADKSKAVEALSAMPKELQQQLPMSYYWGGIGGTQGPPYIGAIVCFLAILSFFVLDGKYKWGALAAIIFAILLSWGEYFKTFNYALFDILPLLNKFRAPSMALVIPQLLLPFLAALGLNKIMNSTAPAETWPALKKGLIATGAVFAILFLMYFSFDFTSENDKMLLKQAREMGNPQIQEMIKSFVNGLKEDRSGLMIKDIFRSLGFILIAGAALFLYSRKQIKPLLATLIIGVFALADLLFVDTKYLNESNYSDKTENQTPFIKSRADEEILADKSHYRVMNFAGDVFAESVTSYYYNSVGGYHAVKLRLYQDLIEKQMSSGQPNINVLNMLNTKYFIQRDPSTRQTRNYQKNDGALGPVWFVKHVSFVKTADAEMAALTQFNPKDTAFVRETFKPDVTVATSADSTARIWLTKNNNDVMEYESQSAVNQFAVFSEIYYKAGWKATIDGKEVPIVKTNYVLRGLSVPAGKHTIKFSFEPQGFLKGKKITTIASILVLILVAISVFFSWRNLKKDPVPGT